MGVWTERFLPYAVDRALSLPPARDLRRRACAGLSGAVIEIGFGSGLNVPHYPDAVTSVTAVEPSLVARRLAARHLAAATVPVTFTGVDGADLPLPDAAYDAALSSWTLCTIPDAVGALRELGRVLKPGRSLHFVEHGVAPDDSVARWQRRLDPLEQRIAGGCHLTRDIAALLRHAGWEMTHLETFYADVPRPVRPWGFIYLGRAVRP